MVSALFKEFRAADSYLNSYDPETRVVSFWLHQPTRLTDGHIAIHPDGTSRITVNWSGRGTRIDVTDRACMDAQLRRDEAGFSEWSDDQVSELLTKLDIAPGAAAPLEALADVIAAPMQAEERVTAQRLSIRWDAQEPNISDAIGLRYMVTQKAEAILNDAGLLVDPKGTVVADDTVSVTLEVAEFDTAKSLLWDTLSPEERRYNCQIQQG